VARASRRGHRAPILEKSRVTKPTWIFVLSWLHGIQHGQDPLMFTDAGITMLAPMLYQVPDRGHFDTLTRSWNEYIDEGQANIVPGDQVDFYWHQKRSRTRPRLRSSTTAQSRRTTSSSRVDIPGRVLA
jgi:hypothetical protein